VNAVDVYSKYWWRQWLEPETSGPETSGSFNRYARWTDERETG